LGMSRIPRSQRHGTEPDDALSDLPLRRILSRIALIAGVAGAALCAWFATLADLHEGVWVFAAAMFAGMALIAAIDLGVIRHRFHQMHERARRQLHFPHPR
ncbi:MAG: hypothetical protein HOV68_09545, partial [Streptomycetaceae bacterium]|nr:hypothetical protein [Streptomycetaceae bacterium]